MKKLAFLLIAASLMLVPMVALAHDEANPYVTNLTADGGSPTTAVDVGDVLVWNDANNVYVKYLLANPVDNPLVPEVGEWCMTQTHLAVEKNLADIPQTKKKSPIPGQFEYGDPVLGCTAEASYPVPNTWTVGTELFIAAHAVVQKVVSTASDLPGFEAALPSSATISVKYPVSGGPAYFPHTYITSPELTGDFLGWCVDTDHVIYQNTNYTANVYSSYETLPEGLVEYPQNFDLVNWIINQGFVGKSSGCGGAYTYGDVQRAIWELIDDTASTAGLGSWSQCRVNEIKAAASASGEGYVPPCGGFVAVVLAPVDNSQVIIAQVITAQVQVACTAEYESETAWGGPYPDFRFNKNDWSIYFKYTVQ